MRLLDVNLLVPILHRRHEHAQSALAWLETQTSARSLLVCRVAQMGALRLLTQPSAMKEDVKTPAEFWIGWDRAMQDDRFVFVEEPGDLEEIWRSLCRGLQRGASGNTDLYLAAFAQASEATFATFDKGFARFPDLRLELLTP